MQGFMLLMSMARPYVAYPLLVNFNYWNCIVLQAPPRYSTLQLGTKVTFNCCTLIGLMVLGSWKENTTLSWTQMYHL